MTSQTEGLGGRLAAALRPAMKARDRVAVSALRSTLAALANAEAVAPAAEQPTTSADVAGAAVGVGATEAERRVLTDREAADLVLAEATEREDAARAYDETGQTERAEHLRAEAAVIRTFLDRSVNDEGPATT